MLGSARAPDSASPTRSTFTAAELDPDHDRVLVHVGELLALRVQQLEPGAVTELDRVALAERGPRHAGRIVTAPFLNPTERPVGGGAAV